MTLTNAFKETVSSGNIRRVRIMMKDSMLNDPTFSEFNLMNIAARDLSGLYDIHDGRDLEYDKNKWDDSLLDELMVQVVGNFSHERVDHLKNVVGYLRPVSILSPEVQLKNGIQKTTRQTNQYSHGYQKPKNGYQENHSNRGTKIVGGAVIGAVVGGAVVAATSISIIWGISIGAVTGAVVGTITTTTGDK